MKAETRKKEKDHDLSDEISPHQRHLLPPAGDGPPDEGCPRTLGSRRISETPESLTLQLEVPGLTRDQIKISVENNTLSVRGEKVQETSSEDESFHRTERSFGAFERSFALPPHVDTDQVKASLNAGVLAITLPRREEAKAREITIEGGGKKRIEA